MTYEVKLGNNLSLKMKLISDKGENNKEVIFIYEDNNCTYEGKEKLKYLEGTEDKQFFENKDNYKYDLEKKENENEIILFISKNNKKLSVSLKNTTTPGEDDIKEPAPINNPNEILKPKEMPTPNNNFPEEYIAKMRKLICADYPAQNAKEYDALGRAIQGCNQISILDEFYLWLIEYQI